MMIQSYSEGDEFFIACIRTLQAMIVKESINAEKLYVHIVPLFVIIQYKSCTVANMLTQTLTLGSYTLNP